MSEESEKKYSNELLEGATLSYEAFTWRIPSVSSILHQLDVVQSPPFAIDGASFILKMYPYGQGGEGSVEVILERYHSQRGNQNIFIKMFCIDVFDKKVRSINTNYLFTQFYAQSRQFRIMENLENSCERWRIAPDDTVTLICALGKKKSDLNKEGFKTKSVEENVGERYRTRRNYGNREIFKEYSDFKHFSLKICRIAPVPDGYYIREQITFANAIWILKIYPNFRMVNSNKQCIDMVLERLQTEIPEHHVFLEIDIGLPTHEEVVENFFIFNRYRTEGKVFTCQLKGEEEKENPMRCIHFHIVLRSKKITGVESDSYSKSSDQVIVDGSSTVLQNSKVFQDYKNLFLQHEDCDVTIKVRDREFLAHRLILKSRSPVLGSAFRHNMKEKATSILNIEDCEPSTFSQFLHFLYCGEVESLSEDNAFELFTVADKYDVPDLRSMCLEFMKQNLSIDTFCDIVVLALLHSEAELIELCTDFLTINLQQVIETVKWQTFITENPIQGNELMIKALVKDNSLRSRDPDRQTQRVRQTRRVKDTQKRTQQDKDQQRGTLKDRGTKRKRYPQRKSSEEKPSTEENYKNKFCSIM